MVWKTIIIGKTFDRLSLELSVEILLIVEYEVLLNLLENPQYATNYMTVEDMTEVWNWNL